MCVCVTCLIQDDDRCEEWERHEALHEDVTSQERTKERLYEEEIELKWEKGGSGLVFYTDAQYWQEEEGGKLLFRTFVWLLPLHVQASMVSGYRLNYKIVVTGTSLTSACQPCFCGGCCWV